MRGRGGRSEIHFQNAFLKWNLSATTPSAALRWLRSFLLMPQPPLLTRRSCPNCDQGQETFSSELALKPTPVFSRGAATECSPGRKPGVGVVLVHQPRRGERLFRPYGAEILSKENPGLRPGLPSVAAPRLFMATHFGQALPHEEGNVPSNCDFLCKAPPGLGSRTTLNPDPCSGGL